MAWFTPVSSETQRPTIRPGYGGVAGSDDTLPSKLYLQRVPAAETALVKREAFLDAVPGRTATGGVRNIPGPGASSEASGVLARRADWLTWTADSVKDRLDLSAPSTLAAWKADRGNASTLLDVDAGNRSPTGYPTVSDAWREALSGRTPGLLSSAASGNARSEIYNRPLRWTTVSSPYSVRA